MKSQTDWTVIPSEGEEPGNATFEPVPRDPSTLLRMTADGVLIWTKQSFSRYECRLSASVSMATRSAAWICRIKSANCRSDAITSCEANFASTISLTAIRSRAIRHSFWSRAGYRSVFPSIRAEATRPLFCAASARAPIPLDDKAIPRVL